MTPLSPRHRAGACLLGVALALLPLSAPGQERPGRPGGKAALPAAPPAGAAVDVAFFGGSRPVLLRLHALVNGKPFNSTRDAYVKRWFDYLDRNGDGILDAKEAQHVPNTQVLRQFRLNGLFLPQGRVVGKAEVETDGAGRVTLEALTRHFDRAGFAAVELASAGLAQNFYEGPSEVLFKHLDVNKDGKLSKEGVRKGVESLLRKFDTDDDEVLLPQELDPRLAANQFVGRVPPPRVADRTAQVVDAFYLVRSGREDGQLGLLLLSYYDKNKDLKLSRTESGLDRETFDRLDANKDGKLDLDELAHWHKRPADVEMVVRLAGRSPKGVEAYAPDGKPAPLAPAVSRTPEGTLHVGLGDARISVRQGTMTLQFGGGRAGVTQLYMQQFQLADVKNRGFLEMGDLDNNPRGQILRGLFAVADRDGDGKLTKAELTAFAALADGAGTSTLTILAAAQGRTLFQLLDADRDGRLGLRELRTAWERLAPLDRDGDGFVSADEIPRQFDLSVGLGGTQGLRFGGGVARLGPRPVPLPERTRGPLWFRKMDRNGDGDVSFREFLGTREEFNRIDTDGDGLISVEEAERFDTAQRAQPDRRR